MHLLGLGAFWLPVEILDNAGIERLNAPSGAGCFLTFALVA